MKKTLLFFILCFMVLPETVYSSDIRENTVIRMTNEVVFLNVYMKVYPSVLVVKINELVNETIANLKRIGFRDINDSDNLKSGKVMMIEIEQIGEDIVRLGVDNAVTPMVERVVTIDGEIGSYEFKCSIYNLSREIVGKVFFLEVKMEGL